LKTHLVKSGDISIAALPVERDKVNELGIMRIDDDDRIIEFVEKPQDPEVIESLKVSDSFAAQQGLENSDKRWLANMGIYVFETQVLMDALKDESMIDFGKDLLPASLSKYKTVAHLFDGYWEDIGTIKSFFEANIQLGSANPPFDFFGGESEKIFTKQRFLTASRFLGAHIGESIISDGCYIGEGAEIIKSVIGIRSRIGASTHVEEAIVMGADSRERRGGLLSSDCTGVGENVVIKRAILDKNVHIGKGTKIINSGNVDHADGENYYIRDGIVVIPKNTVIPPGSVI
jgi:glucose-1-phosphate adenylyltransferase